MDIRDLESFKEKWYHSVDDSRRVAIVEMLPFLEEVETDEEEQRIIRLLEESGVEGETACGEPTVEIPVRFEVCGLCRGSGTHVNPDIDRQGLTWEDFDQDPDFYEAYRNGTYNVTCRRCGGKRVVPEIVEVSGALKEIVEMIVERERLHAQWAAEDLRAAEMGY
jgi:hypothetical protein